MLLNRRHFTQTLLTSSLLLPFIPLTVRAAPVHSQSLTAASRTLEVNGKSATVYGLTRPNGMPGLELVAEQEVSLNLQNHLNAPTMIHWHGLTPALEYDGMPDHPLPLLSPGETRSYQLPSGLSGTHWMHAHPLQEQQLLAAPLIVRSKEDVARDEQDIVMLLHDFSFKSPEELLSELTGGMAGHDHSAMAELDHNAMPSASGSPTPDLMMPPHGIVPLKLPPDTVLMDVNDVNYDAYLTNDRTFSDPEVIRVEKSGRIRLRVINAASSTGFTIDTGSLQAQVIAVDGQEVVPLAATRWPLSMGQRVDLRLQIPRAGGSFVIRALREGDTAQTGLILATPGAKIAKQPLIGDGGPLLSLDQESLLQSLRALPVKPADQRFMVKLTGTMLPYQWQMTSDAPLQIKRGERVEVTLVNESRMSHPIHLHGHHFQVMAINGKPLGRGGALRDTVLVPPQASVTVAFDAANPGDYWAFHCHHLYHMLTGMMTSFAYS